jgi:hypothetical protein
MIKETDQAPFDPFGGEIIASNGALHASMTEVIRSASSGVPKK